MNERHEVEAKSGRARLRPTFVALAIDEREEIAKLANEDGRSVSGFLRQLVRARLADEPRVRP